MDQEEKSVMQSFIDAADYNSEFNYSDVARFFSVKNNTITRWHPVWGEFNRKIEYNGHREWKRGKYNEDDEWRKCLRRKNNAYFDKKYHADEKFRRNILDSWRGNKRSKDKLLSFLDTIDLEKDMDIVMGKDFPEYAFGVLALLSEGGRQTINGFSKLLGKAPKTAIEGIVYKMKNEGLLCASYPQNAGPQTYLRYYLADQGFQLLDYLGRNVVEKGQRRLVVTIAGRNRV